MFLLEKGDASGCGITDEIVDWMNKIQESGEAESLPPPSVKNSSKNSNSWWWGNGNSKGPSHKYSREANSPTNSEGQNVRTRRAATRAKEDANNKNTCSLFIQTDPLIWRHIHDQVRWNELLLIVFRRAIVVETKFLTTNMQVLLFTKIFFE